MDSQGLVGKSAGLFASHQALEVVLMDLQMLTAVVTHGIVVSRDGNASSSILAGLHQDDSGSRDQNCQEHSFHKNTSQWCLDGKMAVRLAWKTAINWRRGRLEASRFCG